MSKAKAGLRGLNAADKQRRASIILDHMNGNPLFPDPSPSMVDFGQALDELREANLAALDRGRAAIFRRDRAEQKITEMITRLAGYLNSICAGDRMKITSAGFVCAKQPQPISSLRSPKGATVRSTPYPSQLKVRWERVRGALMYRVEVKVVGAGGQEEWQEVALTSRPKVVVEGLRSDQFHKFRICAVGTRVEGPYTEVFYTKAA